ncbi:MAG: hypothetical protein R3A78_13835 [Polyangiales bacterium]
MLARRMIEEARAAGVPVLRDVPLARAPPRAQGRSGSEDLYEAVAIVLRAAWEARRGGSLACPNPRTMQTTLGDVLADSGRRGPAFVEVAIGPAGVCLRMPSKASARALRAGARVAVPFAGQVVGIVVRGRDAAPEGVKRILAVADVIEREPVFHA